MIRTSKTTTNRTRTLYMRSFCAVRRIRKMTNAQTKIRQRVTLTASSMSGGHGIRTRNRLPGTSFPVRPLANSLTLPIASEL
jgi:hypothetical protein